MQRRKAIATAGAVTLTAIGGVLALGANLGLFGLTQDDSKVGDFPSIDPAAATSPAPPSTRAQVREPGADQRSRPTFDDEDENEHEGERGDDDEDRDDEDRDEDENEEDD
jgi:hypothetical protein